ncbi:MAG TPA: hypothetical protein VFY05_05705 [Candidatus Angelobacter sp.]|nr:hypothetical protein [Candidatus Angelobacter sp.]
MTREEIIAAIRECAEKLGRTPRFMELLAMFPSVKRKAIRREFVGYAHALEACGLEGHGVGYCYSMKTLFRNWSAVVRELHRLPSMAEYELYSKSSYQPLTRRFKSWLNVPRAMAQYAVNEGLEQEYADVLEIVKAKKAKPAHAETRATTKAEATNVQHSLGPRSLRPLIVTAGQVYGVPLMTMPLAFGPVNEAGVLFLFGMLAHRLGFIITHVQTGFPDCQALLRLDDNTCQMVKIELEYESRNFLEHGHSVKGCDFIVCWIHNWPECPLEVIELRGVLMEMAGVK